MSYNRGYRNGNNREPARYLNHRQLETNGVSKKDVSRTQDDSGVKAVTNNGSSESSSQRESMSADEKRKLRQAKLALWKKKQGTLEPELVVVVKKPTIAMTLKRPVLSKPSKTVLKQPIATRSLFADEYSDQPKERVVKKPKISTPEESAEDPLDMFMKDISTEKTTEDTFEREIIEDEYDVEETNNEEESLSNLLSQSNNLHKFKDIPQIPFSDHTIVKRFYNQELNSTTEEEFTEFSTVNQITIKPESKQYKNIKEFGQLGLTSKMLETLQELNFTEPTPIQKIALPVIMAGNDVIAVAKTGSGKTLSFILPMIRHIVANLHGYNSNQTPIGLILTPTRELALQIHKDCKPFLKKLDLRAVCCYGGSNISSQIADLKKGAELLVCTPGRLIDLLTANNGRVTNLSQVSSLVLDEADRMFDLGFEPQIMKIIKNIRPDRQTCLFSATFARKIENMATKVLQDPIQLIVGGGRSIVSETITQRVMVVKPEEKIFKLLSILGEFLKEGDSKVLIFCSTQDRCDNLLTQVLQRGFTGLSIHGGKNQQDRDGAIDSFQKGTIQLLVATSIAARGLDVKDLGLVINYDAPNHMEDYVHRVGRTGRAGNTGIAYTFVEPSEERAASDISKALKLSKNIVPDEIEILAVQFQEKLKDGKEKYVSGFGGKGLEKLDENRVKNQNLERRSHQVEEVEPVNKEKSVKSTEELEKEVSLIDFSIIEGPVPGKVDSRLFHSKIYINDLPQKVRVDLSQEYPYIIEQTNVSITTKGTFTQDNNSKADKLHILVENDDSSELSKAVSMLKTLIIEGIKESNEDELRKLRQGNSGKYGV